MALRPSIISLLSSKVSAIFKFIFCNPLSVFLQSNIPHLSSDNFIYSKFIKIKYFFHEREYSVINIAFFLKLITFVLSFNFFSILSAAQEQIGRLDVLVCGQCHSVFHFVEEFQEHRTKEGACSKVSHFRENNDVCIYFLFSIFLRNIYNYVDL